MSGMPAGSRPARDGQTPAHPLDAFVSRHRRLPALLVVLALAVGAVATYLFMFAYRHDDGPLDYQELYALAFVLTGSAATTMWLGITAGFARSRVAPTEMDLDRPPGLGEPSQVRGLARATGVGMLVVGAGFIALGIVVGRVEGFDAVVLACLGVGAATGALGMALWGTASR